MKKVLILLLVSLFFSNTILFAKEKECKIWLDFVKSQKSKKEALLLDFSYAGYHHGEKELPLVDYKIFDVCDFGAIPNDHQSDREAVEKAIKAAELNGSGVVFFPKGRYRLHQKGEPSAPITIRRSCIVLRGEGAGADGSELFMEEPNEAVNPEEKWTSPCLFSFTGRALAHQLTPITGDAKRSSFSVEVKDTKSLKAGDWICLRLNNNSKEVIAKELAPYTIENDWTNMLLKGVQVYDYHQIVSVKRNKLTFKEPLMREVKASEEWFIQTFPMIEEIGVEDLAFVGNWKDKFIHHKDWRHDGGWKFLEFKNVVHSWVTRCRFTDVSEAVSLTSTANVSVTDCVITGNVGHNAMHAQGSSRSFLGAIDDEPSQWHSVSIAKHTMGTVIWRTLTRANSCFESHASQPRATLIDACEGGFMRGRAGGAIQNNPNHLSDLVLWNYKELDEGTKEFDFWATDTRYWRFLPPIIVGFHGSGTTFTPSQVAYEESNGVAVNPESLYEAQLKHRLGKLPQWVVELKQTVANNSFAGKLHPRASIKVKSTADVEKAMLTVQAGDTIYLEDGVYTDIKLIVHASGNFTQPIVIKALHAGKAFFSGDVRVELRGNHIQLSDIYFKDGTRSNKEWKSHGPGLVSIYGDYCTVSDCLFYSFDDANSAYITTSLDEQGRVPRYGHIHHCAFIEKTTLDQVINLNNTLKKSLIGEPGIPMYHRVNNCYFSNPPKKGNAGGGIRIGYWRKDYGRCLIDNNLFERQDSEGEIVTSKSMENVFYKNTILNCRGTLNFRHGDKQVALNNFFIGTDSLYQYGGMFVWGSNHLIGANYFSLPRTLTERGNAAISFNPGPKGVEHALAYDISVINNHFMNNNGGEFNFSPLYTRRVDAYGKDKVELPHDIRFIHNKIFSETPKNDICSGTYRVADKQVWKENLYSGIHNEELQKMAGLIKCEKANLRHDDSKIYIEDIENRIEVEQLESILSYKQIEGIDLDFVQIVRYAPSGSPLNRRQVGPSWCKEFPGSYADTGIFNKKIMNNKLNRKKL